MFGICTQKDADGDAVDYSQSPFIDVEKLKRKFTLLDNDTWLLGRTSPFRSSNMLYVEGNDKLIAMVINSLLLSYQNIKINICYHT